MKELLLAFGLIAAVAISTAMFVAGDGGVVRYERDAAVELAGWYEAEAARLHEELAVIKGQGHPDIGSYGLYDMWVDAPTKLLMAQCIPFRELPRYGDGRSDPAFEAVFNRHMFAKQKTAHLQDGFGLSDAEAETVHMEFIPRLVTIAYATWCSQEREGLAVFETWLSNVDETWVRSAFEDLGIGGEQ